MIHTHTHTLWCLKICLATRLESSWQMGASLICPTRVETRSWVRYTHTLSLSLAASQSLCLSVSRSVRLSFCISLSLALSRSLARARERASARSLSTSLPTFVSVSLCCVMHFFSACARPSVHTACSYLFCYTFDPAPLLFLLLVVVLLLLLLLFAPLHAATELWRVSELLVNASLALAASQSLYGNSK